MTKDEALRLALEALEDLGMKHYENTGEVLYKNTYTAIKAALQAKDEPVAWAFFFEDGEASNELFDTREQGEKWLLSDDCLWAGSLKPLYTTPPQRTWVGLSDEDKQDWIKCMPWPPEPAHLMVLIEGVELELKELNR